MPNYTVDQLREYGPEPLMRWLIPIVRHGGTITYGRVAERLAAELKIPGRILPVQIGHVAGSLEDKLLEIDEDIPLLNVLVVDTTGKPGPGIDGYLKERYGRWRFAAQRQDICARAARSVYEYDRWNDVYTTLFAKNPPKDTELQSLSGNIRRGCRAFATSGGWKRDAGRRAPCG